MKVMSETNGNVKNIYVLGDLVKASEKELFFQTIADCGGKELSITFYDALVLEPRIIRCLAELGEVIKEFRIYVVKDYLYSYLNRLGFGNVRIIYKDMKKKHANRCVEKVYAENAEDLADYRIRDEKIIGFLEDVYVKYGYKFTEYNFESVKRRIKVGMIKSHIEDFDKYFEIVLSNAKVFEELFLIMSINVTEFFRDPLIYQKVSEKILPYLESYPSIKIWCAGCSTGEEVYSLAILLEEMNLLNKATIYGTDINPCVIQEAKNGYFSKANIEKSNENYKISGGKRDLENYFNLNSGLYGINESIRKKVLFFEHSLLEKGILNEFQLIFCRNVLIYFNNNLKKVVFDLFYNSLDVSGFLVLGKSETIFFEELEKKFTIYDLLGRVYQKAIE